jgi:hypothetical protein
MLYLPDASFTTKHLTVTILANLSCNEKIREMLRYTGLAANLIELIANSSNVDLLEPAVIVVTNLAIDEVLYFPSFSFVFYFPFSFWHCVRSVVCSFTHSKLFLHF